MKDTPMNTTHYLLHPRAPLVFGTGKPLDFGLGGDSLSFPYPSTVAGAVHAAQCAASGAAPNSYAPIEGLQLQQLALASFDWMQTNAQPTLLLPRPADAVYINQKMLHLAPVGQASKGTPDGEDDSWTDLACGLQILALQGKADDKKGKPDTAPAWWRADDYSQWLANPKSLVDEPISNSLDTKTDERTHVVIDPHGKGAVAGGLFRSTGRDFGPHTQNGGSPPLGLAIAIAVQEPQSLQGATRRLGGEGRFVRFDAPATPWKLPTKPNGLEAATRIRFILTTPAVFPAKGWHPDALSYDQATQTISGTLSMGGKDIQVTLLAAALSRAQSYSGWQPPEKKDGHPGPGRPWRVVPAGSVYWFEVAAGVAPKLWGQSVCTDTATDRWHSNGWGRGLVGLA